MFQFIRRLFCRLKDRIPGMSATGRTATLDASQKPDVWPLARKRTFRTALGVGTGRSYYAQTQTAISTFIDVFSIKRRCIPTAIDASHDQPLDHMLAVQHDRIER